MAKRDLKSKPKRRRVVFSLDTPKATEVFVAGDFNVWKAEKHPLKRNPDGVWKKIAFLLPGSYEYKFIVDGVWELDPKNQRVCPNQFGTQNNVITISAK